ncbi:MAG: DUF4115 domain-containing protein [Alcanivoracaceae bacterium]|nr:DUF4115 domain-containing protein [Alcanivoracaceae bacterium]
MKSENTNTNNNDLRTIRKDKGLSLSDVSTKLKLTAETIRKMENSEFMDLGAYTYVRGYLIHYTALLDIDAEKYLKLIPKIELDVPLINTSANLTKGIKLKRHSKNMASYLLGTFLVLIISFSGWYLLKNYSDFSVNNRNNIKIVDKNSLSSNSISDQQNIDMSIAENETKEESYHYSSLIPSNDTNSDNNQVEITIPMLSTDALSAETVLKANEESSKSIVDSAYKIIIEAKETSWVKVEKMDGSKLHNDLLQPGSIILESNHPLHFRIGNEKNVTVTINDEAVDLSKYSIKDIADFNWPIES